MIIGISFYEIPASLFSWVYGLVHSYAGSIAIVAVIVMAIATPLVLKSTAGMLKMQTLAPELKRIQKEYAGDPQTQRAEQMKLYQDSGVNPMASCWPMVIQMPIFIIMFRVLHGLTFVPLRGNELVARAIMNASGVPSSEKIGFFPRFIGHDTALYQSLVGKHEMPSWGLDLSKSALEMLQLNTTRGVIYVLVVALYGVLSLVQQRMVAARAALSPTMSPTQQKLMQYLPVFFAIFQLFFLLALVIYYIFQTIIRIGQQAYITHRFYGHDEALGRKAQAASQTARELHGDDGGLAGMFKRATGGGDADSGGRAKQQVATAKKRPASPAKQGSTTSKQRATNTSRPKRRQTTAPKGRPTPKSGTSKRGRPKSKAKRRK